MPGAARLLPGRLLPAFRAYLDDAARVLAAGWGARGGRRALVVVAARHAVDFHTWRSLARDGGVRRAGVVELALAMVSRAARGTSPSPWSRPNSSA